MLETIKTKELEAYNSLDAAEKVMAGICLLTLIIVIFKG